MTVVVPARPARPIVIESAGKVPRGGTLGQALIKASAGDYDTEWGTAIAAAAWGSITGTLAAQADLTAALAAKQDALVSGTNIKTLNGSTILGSGNLVVGAAWGAITGTLSAQTDLQAALDVGSQRIPDDYISQNSAELLSDLKVTAAASARFAGAYRSRDLGVVNWYFAAQAMTLAPEAFDQADRQAFCATAIDKGVVGPRLNTTAYTQNVFVTFPSGKVFFCNIAGTSAGSAPSDAGATTAGDFLGDGTITWEYTGLQVPASWQWFMVDIAANLLSVDAPDSTDAYPAMLASAAELANVDAAWLNTASAHPGQTRAQVIDLLIQNGMTDDLTGASPGARLSYVFQNQLNPAGAADTTRYLADNVEVWRGYIAQAALLTIVGSSPTAALQNAADVKTGILSTQLFDASRFKAYVGRPNWDTITGDAVYATDFRFHLFPSLYGMLDGVTQQQLYGDDVALYIKANVPGLFTASLDTFPMAESFYAQWRLGWETAKDVAFWRVTSRGVANVVITDAALMAKWLGFTYADPVVSSGGVSDGDKGDITVSSSGTVWTIDNGAVTLAKQANMATSSLVYRKTAGSGAPEVNTLATLKTDLGLTGTNSGDQTITLTGDVTGSGAGSFAATIGNNAVTFAKMADIATDSLIGRDTAATGDPEAITVTGGIEFSGAGSIRTSAFTGDVTKTAGGTALTIATDVVTNTQLANMAANTVKANATAGAADPADLAVGTNTVVGRVAGNIVAAQLVGNQIADDAVVNGKLANVNTATIKGRVSGGIGDPEDLTGTQATTLLDTFTSALKGLAPASGGGTTNFLRADGTWAAAGGGGSLTVQDEGITLSAAVTTINFTGAGVTATGTTTVTVDIPGGGAGSFDYGINAAMSGLTAY